MRLRDGNTRYGRVEVCISETWTTVCDNQWNYGDASVACRQLGFSPYGTRTHGDRIQCYTCIFNCMQAPFQSLAIITITYGRMASFIPTALELRALYGIVLMLKLIIV